MAVSRPPLLHRVSLSGGTLPAPFHSHADTNVSAADTVTVSPENVSRVTVSHHGSLVPNGTDTRATSQSKQHADTLDTDVDTTPSTSQPNGNVTLSASQSSNGDVALSNGTVTLAGSVAVAPSISATVSRQLQ